MNIIHELFKKIHELFMIISQGKVSKRAGTKNSDNRTFKLGNRYSDKSAPPIKSDDNELGFRGPKY
jgi:hypothetical protein